MIESIYGYAYATKIHQGWGLEKAKSFWNKKAEEVGLWDQHPEYARIIVMNNATKVLTKAYNVNVFNTMNKKQFSKMYYGCK